MINRQVALMMKALVEPAFPQQKLSGLVKTMEKSATDGSKRRLTFPASHDYEREIPLLPNEYEDMTPNSREAIIMFFEDHGVTVGDMQRNSWEYISRIRLVFYGNHQLLPTAYSNELAITQRLLQLLSKQNYNAAPFQRVTIKPESLISQEQRPFGRYSFDQTTRQYLMLPYIAGAIEFKVNFQANPLC